MHRLGIRISTPAPPTHTDSYAATPRKSPTRHTAVITFALGLSGTTILLTSGQLALNTNLTVDTSFS
jgi:hypothetical protein